MLAGYHAVNAYGKAAGLTQLAELGTIESPILLTNTLAVGAVWEGGLRHLLEQNPDAARDRDTVNVIVGECFDGWLSDARALAVRPERALEAIAAASAEETAEGAVGAGTGTTCFGFKAGVGTSSRAAGGQTLGCLVRIELRRAPRPAPACGRGGRRGRDRTGAAGAGRLDHDRAGHRRPDVGAPAAQARVTGNVRAREGGQPRPRRERRVRDRLLDRSPGRAPGGARSRRLHLPARRLGRDARSVRGRGRGGAGVGPELAVRGRRDGGPDGNRAEAFPQGLLGATRSFGGTD